MVVVKNPKEPVEVGEVFTFFSKVGVAGIKLSGALHVGDKVKIKGATTDLEMVVDSIQIDRQPVEEAGKGVSVGIKVSGSVRPGDKIFRL